MNLYHIATLRDHIANIPVNSISQENGSGTASSEDVSIPVPMPPPL